MLDTISPCPKKSATDDTVYSETGTNNNSINKKSINPENIESQNLSFEAQTEKDRISKFELHNPEFEEQYQRLHSENNFIKEKSIKEKGN